AVDSPAFFQHVRYHESTLHDEPCMKRLGTFLNQYGFARNLAFTFLAISVALAVKHRFEPRPELARYAITAAGAGALLFYRYLKFYRQYAFELYSTFAGRK